MAGSDVSIAEGIDDRRVRNKPIKKVYVKWTSDDTTGDASGSINHVNGLVVGLETKPGSAGDQPTTLYDVTLEDEFAHDVLEGAGADRSNTTVEKEAVLIERTITASFGVHPAVCSTLTFKVANAGNSKKGEAIIYFM